MPCFSVLLSKSHQMNSRRHTVTPWDIIISRYDITWHHISWQNGSEQSTQVTISKSLKVTVFNVATLTFDLWHWPLKSSEVLSRSILTPISNSCTFRATNNWQTHTQDRFYTLYRWHGRGKPGNNSWEHMLVLSVYSQMLDTLYLLSIKARNQSRIQMQGRL